MRVLPDFVIIGGKKCGTSSLYNYLVEHPQVAAAFRKEVHFFDNDAGHRNTLRYRAYFPTSAQKYRARRKKGSNLVTGEATPYYLFYPPAPRRLKETVPHARLIALLRNPVDRAYSHYHHEVRNGTEELPFEEAIGRESERLNGEQEMISAGGYDSPNHRMYSYLSRGIYVDQLRNWRAYFPEKQLLVLGSEDLFADPSTIVGETLDFLGLPPSASRAYAKANEGGYVQEMNDATRKRLLDFFRPHNERLYEYLGRDFGWDG